MSSPVVVSVLVDLPASHRYHRATIEAIRHASEQLAIPTQVRVFPTDGIPRPENLMRPGSAIVVGPGSPYVDPDAVHSCIRAAREAGIPLVGTWGGFQHVLVEHARSLAGIPDASHAEYGEGGHAVITLLACSLQDQTIRVDLTPGSRLEALYGRSRAEERTTCSYGLAPDMQHIAGEHGMQVSATDETGEVRAIERGDHPFFMGTLFQPQLSSAEGAPHPVFIGLLSAAVSQAG